jgi:hypothetical protein
VIERILFWLVGAALFLAVAILPNLLLAWFYTGGRVHAIVIPTCAVLCALMWGSSRTRRQAGG